jgi:O-methyltransferase
MKEKMQLKKSFKKIINLFLRPLNYKMTSKGLVHNILEEYDETKKLYYYSINQIQSFYAEFIDKKYFISNNRTELLQKLKGTEITESLYIVSSILDTINLEGDICEFGIAQGATSALMCNEILTSEKSIWLFDSFEGLPAPTEKDILLDDISNFGSMEKYAGSMAVPVTSVLNKLKNINFPKNRLNIVAGFIEKTILQNYLPKKVSFAYVDFDLYEPIKIALNFLDKVLVENGVIIIDDYGFFSSGSQYAVDEFYEEKKSKYILIKPVNFAGHFIILKKLKN